MAKKTAAQVKQEVSQLLEAVKAAEDAARGEGQSFSCLDEKQLAAKVRGATSKSPFIYAQSWTSGASAGANASYTVYVNNPDPTAHFPLYATIFFGLGNFTPIQDGWAGRDERWPYVSSDRTFLAATSNASFRFDYAVPSLPKGTYNGNSVIWEGSWHDIGQSFDRGSFDLRIN